MGSKPTCFGFLLRNGSRVVHGSGVPKIPAFKSEPNIPGILHLYNPGAAGDPSGATPSFRGAHGYFPFDMSMRMPRHVHISPPSLGPPRFITEKVLTLTGVGMVELAGEIFVVPPLTMIMIAAGVPHTWMPAPPGLDFQALGLADEKLKSNGNFTATFEYSDDTSFFPTAQTERLNSVEDYIACNDLERIRFPEMTVEDVKKQAFFIWGHNALKL